MRKSNDTFDLQKHIVRGVEAIVADTLKATLKNPKESAFMAKFAAASRKASKTRLKLEREGLHVPGFLIASITSSCNLHCAGCYSRCSNATNDAPPVAQLTSEERSPEGLLSDDLPFRKPAFPGLPGQSQASPIQNGLETLHFLGGTFPAGYAPPVMAAISLSPSLIGGASRKRRQGHAGFSRQPVKELRICFRNRSAMGVKR